MKVGLVALGYVGALALAGGLVAVHVALTDGPAAQASSGMYAFGDMLMFLAVAGLGSALPTGFALFWLRPWRPFWIAASGLAVLAAVASLASLGVHLATRHGDTDGGLGPGDAALLVLIATPLSAGASLLAGLFAPGWAFRLTLLGASVVKAAVFASAVFVWLSSTR